MVPEDCAAGDLRAELIAVGDLIPAVYQLPFLMPAPCGEGSPTLSQKLAELRDEERY